MIFILRLKILLFAALIFPFICFAADEWKPPVGIPRPTFGISETHWMFANPAYKWNYGNGLEAYRVNEFGPYTHYIDNTHPDATDTSNTFGSPDKPRRTWLYPLPAGSAVQIHGGPYNFTNSNGSKLAAGGNGNEANPIFFYGTTFDKEAMPRISNSEFYFYGDWLIVERLRFINNCSGSTRPLLKGAPVINTVVRDCYFTGTGTAGNSTAISTGGSSGNSAVSYTHNLVILRNEIYGYGNVNAATENDACGVIASQFATNIWVLDNNIYNMGGDSIRIGADQGDLPSGGYYYIGRNRFHDNRENAVDVKQARNAVISENIMYGFTPSSSDSGTAVAIHYGPQNIWLLNNIIYNSTRGIASTGVGTDCYIVGNIVHSCTEYGMYLARGGGRFHVFNNTVSDSGSGLVTSGVVEALYFKNNLVSNITSANGYHLQISDGAVASRSTASNFMFFQPDSNVRIDWADTNYNSVPSWITATGKGTDSTFQNPNFVNSGNNAYKLGVGSPAINTGVDIAAINQTYQNSFGNQSILLDIDGNLRPTGSKIDIGADEFVDLGQVPASPGNLKIGN